MFFLHVRISLLQDVNIVKIYLSNCKAPVVFLDAPYFIASTYNISSFYIFSLKTFWYVASWNSLFNIFRKEWHEVKYTRYPTIVPKKNTWKKGGYNHSCQYFLRRRIDKLLAYKTSRQILKDVIYVNFSLICI